MEMQSKGSILIVDDSPTNIQILIQILSDDYNIRLAKDGESCLEMAHRYSDIDLILLDIIMPGLSGLEVITELKNDESTHHIPIIFITSMDTKDSELVGLTLGAVDYITKPFVPEIVRLRVSLHMQLIQQMRTIERFSMFDSLTGLRNRRDFEYRMEEEWDLARIDSTELGLIILDIDDFREFNNRYSYHMGDSCIRLVGRILKQSINRPDGFTFRLEGEKFAIVLPETPKDTLEAIAEQVRHDVEHAPVIKETDGNQAGGVTVSMGVGSIVPPKISIYADFYKQVEEALFLAKQNGKNRFESV